MKIPRVSLASIAIAVAIGVMFGSARYDAGQDSKIDALAVRLDRQHAAAQSAKVVVDSSAAWIAGAANRWRPLESRLSAETIGVRGQQIAAERSQRRKDVAQLLDEVNAAFRAVASDVHAGRMADRGILDRLKALEATAARLESAACKCPPVRPAPKPPGKNPPEAVPAIDSMVPPWITLPAR